MEMFVSSRDRKNRSECFTLLYAVPLRSNSCQMRVFSGISRVVHRNHSAIFRSAAETVKHLVRGCCDSNNCITAVFFPAQISCHHADDERPIAGEYDAGVVAHAFEFAGLIGDAQISPANSKACATTPASYSPAIGRSSSA